jgi:hypothetical protein
MFGRKEGFNANRVSTQLGIGSDGYSTLG